MLEQADAALLIGDPALRIAVGIEKDSWSGAEGRTMCQAAALGITNAEMLYVYDVVGEWRSLTDYPPSWRSGRPGGILPLPMWRGFPRLPRFWFVAHPGNLL